MPHWAQTLTRKNAHAEQVLMLNNLASLALVHRTARERSYTAGPYTVRFGQHGACRTSKRYRASFMLPVARDVIVLCAAFCALRQLPRAALCVLHLATMTSRATTLQRARDRANYRSTGGALRTAPVLRRWARSAGRVVTTIVQLGADPAVLLTHLLTVLGCSVMLAQGWNRWLIRLLVRQSSSRCAKAQQPGLLGLTPIAAFGSLCARTREPELRGPPRASAALAHQVVVPPSFREGSNVRAAASATRSAEWRRAVRLKTKSGATLASKSYHYLSLALPTSA